MITQPLITKSTARYWAKQAYTLRVRTGTILFDAIAQDVNNQKTMISIQYSSNAYKIWWFQDGKAQSHIVEIAKSWLN